MLAQVEVGGVETSVDRGGFGAGNEGRWEKMGSWGRMSNEKGGVRDPMRRKSKGLKVAMRKSGHLRTPSSQQDGPGQKSSDQGAQSSHGPVSIPIPYRKKEMELCTKANDVGTSQQ